MIQRERFEEYQKHVYLGRTLASLFGNEMTNVPQIARAEALLELAIFHTAYDPRVIQEQMKAARKIAETERKKRLRDARLLAKVAGYGASNSDNEDAFKTALSKNRFKGVSTPWDHKNNG